MHQTIKVTIFSESAWQTESLFKDEDRYPKIRHSNSFNAYASLVSWVYAWKILNVFK